MLSADRKSSIEDHMFKIIEVSKVAKFFFWYGGN